MSKFWKKLTSVFVRGIKRDIKRGIHNLDSLVPVIEGIIVKNIKTPKKAARSIVTIVQEHAYRLYDRIF